MCFALGNCKAGIIAAFTLSVQFQLSPSSITILVMVADLSWGTQSASEQNSDVKYPQPP